MRAVLILTLLLEFAGNSAFAQNPNAPVGSAPGQAAQAGTPLTLRQAEAMTLRSNPQITIGKLRALQAQQYVRETTLGADAYCLSELDGSGCGVRRPHRRGRHQ